MNSLNHLKVDFTMFLVFLAILNFSLGNPMEQMEHLSMLNPVNPIYRALFEHQYPVDDNQSIF